MFADHLRRIPQFARLPQAEMKVLTASAQVVCVPAHRWLFRHPRALGAYYFLLQGRLHCLQPQRCLRARRNGPLPQIYPGYGAAKTLSPAHIVVISREIVEFVKTTQTSLPNVESAEPWLEKFLSSHMMRTLPKRSWQLLCRNLRYVRFAPGELILRCGDYGDCCYVLASGHAVVQRHGRTLCYLGPGDFFGEDALISGRGRNADVVALAKAEAYSIEQKLFASLLLEELVQFVVEVNSSIVLDLDASSGPKAISPQNARSRALSLDPRLAYTLVGGDRRDRALCALLLIQRGLRANPLH